MSAESSNLPTDSIAPTLSTQASTQQEVPIILVDHTRPPSDDELQRDLTHTLTSTSSRNVTHGSLRQNLARHRYQRSRWQEGRASRNSNTLPDDHTSADGARVNQAAQSEQDEDTWGQGTIERNVGIVKGLVRKPSKKQTKGQANHSNSEIDILYENQRGFFLFGIPRFSSNSLLNFDPSSWVDEQLKPSAVDITNAQVPDPSWQWAWRAWYVDMSRDVDEEGWEYSFGFGRRMAWHGTHPWFHSFVRRRRWLRKRVRKHTTHVKSSDTFGDGHVLNADYFTIHSEPRPASKGSSFGTSEPQSPNKSGGWGASSWEQDQDSSEVKDVPTLMAGLRRAAIDREKIVFIGKFLEQGGDELHYLAENMSEILSLLVFQSSRQQLLSILVHKIESAEAHRNEHKERGEPEDKAEERYIDNMLKAVHAADDQRKRLEYWSDLREMARNSETIAAADQAQSWGHGWQDTAGTGPDSEALKNKEKKLGKDKGKKKVRLVDGNAEACNENVPDEVACEEEESRKIDTAKEEVELRQLAEVGELQDEGDEDGLRLAKVTSFSDTSNDDDEGQKSEQHDAATDETKEPEHNVGD